MIFHWIFFSGQGGDLTLFMTGKKERPATEPIYSGGNLNDFPISSGYDVLDSLHWVHQQLHVQLRKNWHFSKHAWWLLLCMFCDHHSLQTKTVGHNWWICRDYGSFLTFAKEQWEKSRRIYFLACDERLGLECFLWKILAQIKQL